MKYIFFDFDGTISNTYEGVEIILKKTFDKYGLNIDKSQYTKYIGPPLSETFTKLTGDKEKAYEMVAYFRELYVGENAIYKSCLYDGVYEMLRDCHNMQGIFTGVATCKKHEEADELLRYFKIREYIDCLSGLVYNVRESKSSILKYAIDSLGITSKDCVMVGDTIYDVEGAESLGMDCILCLWGFGDFDNIHNKNVIFRAKTPQEATEFIRKNYSEK